MADLGMPEITIKFKGLGVSAVQRGEKGLAVLIVKDDTDSTFTFREYRSIEDLTSEEMVRFTEENAVYIKDVLEGAPRKLIVARMGAETVLADILRDIKGKVEMNCWMALANGSQEEQDDLASFVKSNVKNDKKRYKALVYKATSTDDAHIINYTNETVFFKDDRGEEAGIKALPYLLGYLAGSSLDMSAIANPLQKFERVVEPADLDEAINKGEFILYNDEGEVRVARAINSLITTGEGLTDDMKFILVTEVMDLIYTDIYTTWKRFYKGRYKNFLDNQMLLIGAINSYFAEIAGELLLDPNFENKARVDVVAQRLANIPKYGEAEVAEWDDDKVMEMTVGTNVFLTGNIKILNAMEDFKFIISM